MTTQNRHKSNAKKQKTTELSMNSIWYVYLINETNKDMVRVEN